MTETVPPAGPVRKIRVAIVSDYDFSTGGIEVFLQQVLTCTAGQMDAQLVTWSTQPPVPNEVEVTLVQHGDLRPLWDAIAAADVAMVLTSFNVRALARLAADCLSVVTTPAVVVVHTSAHSSPGFAGIDEQRRVLRDLVQRSVVTVAVSHDVARAVDNLLEERAATHPEVRVIENAARALGSGRISARDGTRRRRPSFVGRPHPQKGFDHFCRLARELSPEGYTFSANTVSIPITSSDPVSFSANLSDAEMRRFFDESDVLVAPYLRADGMPLALLEAVACGVPIIGYDSPGVGALLRQHGQLVIEPRYESLVEAVRAWGDGRLQLAPPNSSVATWAECAAEYVDVLHLAISQR